MITIICSTNRNESISRVIADIYRNLLSDLGTSSEIVDLKDLPADFIDSALYDKAGTNESFNPTRDLMMKSEKFIFIVPEYNGSFPGVLKAFIDGLAFPKTFKNKKAALVGVSAGVQGAGLALSHLTDIFNYCGTHVFAQKPKLSQIKNNMENGRITNSLYQELLETQAREFIDF